jgi:hypothetical protein
LEDNTFNYKVTDPGIHIDHIRPCSSFKLANNPIQQRRCFNYHNLQLLKGEENLRKSNNYDPVAYAQTAGAKAIELLSEGWKKKFSNGPVDDVEVEV